MLFAVDLAFRQGVKKSPKQLYDMIFGNNEIEQPFSDEDYHEIVSGLPDEIKDNLILPEERQVKTDAKESDQDNN